LADEYNSGDYLHPNEKEYEKMAAAFDPEALKRFANGSGRVTCDVRGGTEDGCGDVTLKV